MLIDKAEIERVKRANELVGFIRSRGVALTQRGNAGAYSGNPQTWNGYSYGLNNPLLYGDPDGLKVRICGTDGGYSQ